MQNFLNMLRSSKIPGILLVIQIIISVLLIIVILLQNRGAEVSGLFGGSSSVYRTKRGIERFLHISTIVLAILFLGVGILSLIIHR